MTPVPWLGVPVEAAETSEPLSGDTATAFFFFWAACAGASITTSTAGNSSGAGALSALS
jgi:hypothetical protein